MTVVTGWRAELAVIDGAQVLRTRGDSCMAWPAFWYEVLDDAHEIALKEDKDREWVARELGDVPMVTAKDRPVYDQTQAFSAATTDALMFGTGAYNMCPDGTALPVDMYLNSDYFWG